jgi:hypothetical protein
MQLFFEIKLFLKKSHMNSLAEGSIPDEGSSNKIMRGLPNIAIATYSLRLFPPDKNFACLSN